MKVFHESYYSVATKCRPESVLTRVTKSIPDNITELAFGFEMYKSHPEDYVIFHPDGSATHGYYHGDESVLKNVIKFVEKRNTINNTGFAKAKVLTCDDHQHPCNTVPEPWFTAKGFYEKYDPLKWPAAQDPT
jgi:hypothetical protein